MKTMSYHKRDEFIAALNATGLPWRFGMSRCHWNILPKSNLKPWTAEQAAALRDAATALGYGTTQQLVKLAGRYFDTQTVGECQGFRVY
jgi:hypothetical protein